MPLTAIDAAGFEAKFRVDIDPWNYTASPFEAWKRDLLLHACGPRLRGRGLELACAIGETTRRLAPRCLRLLALDSSQTALDEAARRTRGQRNVTLRQALLPRQMPRGPFDLIVVSEILYYLRPNDLRTLVPALRAALAPGGRLVILHHLRNFDDAAIPPQQAQETTIASLRRHLRLVRLINAGAFQVAALERPALAFRGRTPGGRASTSPAPAP